MRKQHFKKFLCGFAFLLCASTVLVGNNQAEASVSSLQMTTDYKTDVLMSSVEVSLSFNSTSEITMVKYDYAKVAKSVYFTKYKENGYEVKKNSDGTYSFSVTQNGPVSVCAINKDGAEQIITFEINNVDSVAPVLVDEVTKFNDRYLVSLSATDDLADKVTIRYVAGAYASANDPVWESADVFENVAELSLVEGKYTFMATDTAGNTHIFIRKFGDNSSETEEEFRAVWISYLEFKSTGYTKEEFKAQIETMFNEVCAMNMNAVVVHVRPFGDAMYDSIYFPWSKYASGKQGKNPGFDPLEIMVEEAHARGLEFHAWLNPYRVTSGTTDITTLSTDNRARIYLTDSDKSNDRYVLSYGGNLYYNPSSTNVQTLIINGIREIVRNYDVDGIHFDDYFYPTLGKNFTSNFDAKEYEVYKKAQIAANEDYLSIADWRRENVNTLVKNVYSTIKRINPDVVFGISPGGFMDALKADDRYYVDFETWLGYDGYIDYLCPQLYWSNDHTIYPYNDILNRFIDAAVNPDVKLYVGIAAYKAGTKSEGDEWYKNPNVLRNMITYARKTNQVDGFILYRYNYLISKQNYTAMKNMMKEFD